MPESDVLIKFNVCMYKHDDVSYEEFATFSTSVYQTMVKPILEKHGILRWTQTLTPPEYRQKIRDSLKDIPQRQQWSVPEYDLLASYYVRSLDDMTALTADPDWIELEKEASRFADPSRGHLFMGHEILQFQDAEALRELDETKKSV